MYPFRSVAPVRSFLQSFSRHHQFFAQRKSNIFACHRCVASFSSSLKISNNQNENGDLHSSSLLKTLADRSLLHQNTTLKQYKDAAVYFGIDPTAGSLHIGHLPLLLTLCHFQQAGYRPIILIGGATARIGDPSGKNAERPELELKVIENNLNDLDQGLRSFWDRYISFTKNRNSNHDGVEQSTLSSSSLVIVNNEEWFKDLNILDFLTVVGRHTNVATMLSKDSVKNRMEKGGISLLEFMYQTFQAFDYFQLFQRYNCRVQIGGSDQWGNIMAGCQLVRRLTQQQQQQQQQLQKKKENPINSSHEDEDDPLKNWTAPVAAVTTPLLQTSTGEKIGKSAGNAVWLDPKLSNDYELYQWFLRTTDDDLEGFLKIFTFMTLDEINEVVTEHQKQPGQRIGQKTLGREVLTFLRGADAVEKAEFVTKILFGDFDEQNFQAEKIDWALDCFPLSKVCSSETIGVPFVNLLKQIQMTDSVASAKRLVKSGGVSLNGKRIQTIDRKICEEDLISGRFLVFQIGKKEKKVVFVKAG